MAVNIRLTRMGAKKNPFYRIVVAEVNARRDGRFLEVIGTYDPLQDPARITIKDDRLKEWLQRGAQPTTTVASLLRREGRLNVS
jgi:small subunit ribosomal protein S16